MRTNISKDEALRIAADYGHDADDFDAADETIAKVGGAFKFPLENARRSDAMWIECDYRDGFAAYFVTSLLEDYSNHARIAERIRAQSTLKHDTTMGDHILRWKSNGRVVPPDVFERSGRECAPDSLQMIAYEEETAETIATYLDARATLTDEERAVELAEMRAAFGIGTTVVNVLTGERTKL